MAFVTTRDQQQLFTRVMGRGQPVLVLSGLGMASQHWLPFLLPYLHRFKFYIPDYRGFGGSASTPFNGRDNVFESHMQDIEDVVAHFKLKDFLLIGYSLGASTAMHWMQYGNFAQHTIKRYLQIDQTPCIHNKADWPYGLLGKRQAEFLDSLQQLLVILERNPNKISLYHFPMAEKKQLLAIWTNTLVSMLGKPLPKAVLALAPHNAFLFNHLVSFNNAQSMQFYLQSYLQQHYDYRQAIANTPTPVTFFIGEQSLLYAAAGQRLIAKRAKQSKIVPFEKSGHAPLFNEPVKFAKELGHFLSHA